MDTNALKKFAQEARRQLMAQVSSKLAKVLADSSAARRESPDAIKQLESEIQRASQDQIIERVAYTWFNRFSALRFMDANGYTGVKIVSPAEGQTRPEILAEAVAGVVDEEFHSSVRDRVRALLDGQASSSDPQAESYALLLVATCNKWHKTMPFLFEKIADYSELLMPDDLLSVDSVLTKMRATMTEEVCQDVEVIGWLYQFYISEKKDQVFAGLKKNVKITAENIPAATQLFTPHWIVRYLVENSLGRLWILNRPGSTLRDQMDYYIVPEEAETDFLRIGSPEEIKLCDPACGSGHMLTYAFDLLHAIYEEEGYDPATIPDLILTHNLYGVEIDDRAGALAAFALVMKATARRRRFLRSPAQPNICVMQDVGFTVGELADYTVAVGRDLFTSDLRETLGQFDQAKNFGALIMPKLSDVDRVIKSFAGLDFERNLFLRDVHTRVMQVLHMAETLSPKYQVVVANPPYMGTRGLNPTLKGWSEKHYSDSKADLFSMFMERALAMAISNGVMAMINMQSWMFLSSFEKLRSKLLSQGTFLSMAHLGERGFDTIGGAVVSTTAFVIKKGVQKEYKGTYLRLISGGSEAEKATLARNAITSNDSAYKFSASTMDFSGVPGNPIAYWLSGAVRQAFSTFGSLRDISIPRQGNTTTDNARFVRSWFETSYEQIGLNCASAASFNEQHHKWAPYNKGGGSRRWYGQNESVVNWFDNGNEIKAIPHSVVANESSYFTPGITWSTISTSDIGFRFFGDGFVFDNKGASIFVNGDERLYILSLLNTKVFVTILYQINPTVSLQPGDVAKFPVISSVGEWQKQILAGSEECIYLGRSDWDAFETSWDFSTLPILDQGFRQASLAATYAHLRAHWQGMTDQMQALEQENNRIFIDAYGLAGELTPDVPLDQITLTCNPAYRYGAKKAVEELEALLLADTMREFLSYAVGCMFGRYSLNAPGLILANQGDGLAKYMDKVSDPCFAPDADNVIPMLDEDWFSDDVTERFRKFLGVTFGEAKFQENLAFIEAALGKDIRKWFTRDFFDYHVRRYNKRPIYWMFASPKGTFQALIYMHRYTPDTVNVVLNEYVRPFRQKLEAHRSDLDKAKDNPELSAAQQTKAQKDILLVSVQIEELDKWERDIIFPLATQKIAIDLDDGVRANYPKFGAALKTIKGLEAADE